MSLIGLGLKNFAVVHFHKENTVGSVPSGWIFPSEKEGLVCAWPNGPGVDHLLRNPSLVPGKDWKRFHCRVLKYYSKSLHTIYI